MGSPDQKILFREPKGGWVKRQAETFPNTWYYIEKHRNPALPVRTSVFMAIFFEETACCNIVQARYPFAIGPGQIQISDPGPKYFVAGMTSKKEYKPNHLGGTWDSSRTTRTNSSWKGPVRTKAGKPAALIPLAENMVLSNFEFSVRLHTKLFEWEWNGYGLSGKRYLQERSLLSIAQLGGQNKSNAFGARQTTETISQAALREFKVAGDELDRLVNRPVSLPFDSKGNLPESFYEKWRKKFAAALNSPRVNLRHPNPISYKDYPGYWKWFLPDGFIENPRFYLRYGF